MNSRHQIFLVTTVLLVPFFYYASASIPDACAAPPSDEYMLSKKCQGTFKDGGLVTCCWEKDGELQCQSCQRSTDKDGEPVLFCGAVVFPGSLRPGLSGTLEEGGVIEEPTTAPKFGQNVIPKGGGVLERSSEDNIAPSEVNGLSNNSNGTLARDYIKEPEKIEFPNLNILPNSTKSENGEKIDENEATIKDDGQAGPQENVSTMEKEQKEPLTTFLEKNLNNAKDLPSQLKMVKQVKDPYKKLVLLTGIMEEQGKVPPKTTKALNSVLQGDANALNELCNILSTDQGTNIAADICTAFPEQSDNVRASMIEYALVAFLISISEVLLK